MMKENKLKISKNLEKSLNNNTNFFKIAGDIDFKNYSYAKEETVDEYLFRITSGISYRRESENYIVVAGGKIITTLDKVKKMVEEGYNIINSSIISEFDDNTLIEVEYEKLMPKNNKVK